MRIHRDRSSLSGLRGLRRLRALAAVVALAFALPGHTASSLYPHVALKDLPASLRADYLQQKPQMNKESRCAAAFDSHSQIDKMALMCSIYIRMAAEAERRSINYCDEKRAELKIHAPCRIVVEE